MNQTSASSSFQNRASVEVLHSRFARRVTSRLSSQAEALPTDISERLRVAREQAVQRSKAVRQVRQPVFGSVRRGPTLTWPGFGGRGAGLWLKFASLFPLVILVLGLIAIQDWHGENEISAAAEIDASLLADDLPPSAYSDSGFVEFLKSPRE